MDQAADHKIETIRTIGKTQGVLLILLAVSSPLIGGQALHGGFKHLSVMENVVHLASGAWLLLASYILSRKPVYISVAVLSAMFLMLGISQLSTSPGWIHEVIRFVVSGLGVAGIALGLFNKRERAQGPGTLIKTEP